MLWCTRSLRVCAAAVGRSVKKADPVWFSDVSGQHLSKEIYGHTDTHLHTLPRTRLLPWANARQQSEPLGQACAVWRRRLNTKQTTHQTQSKFIRVAGSPASNPEPWPVKQRTIFASTRGKTQINFKTTNALTLWCATKVVNNIAYECNYIVKNMSCVRERPPLAESVRNDSECLSCDNRVHCVHVILVCHVCQRSLCGAACIMGGSGFIMGASLWLLARRQQPQMPLTGCWFSCWSLEVVAGGWAPALGLA